MSEPVKLKDLRAEREMLRKQVKDNKARLLELKTEIQAAKAARAEKKATS